MLQYIYLGVERVQVFKFFQFLDARLQRKSRDEIMCCFMDLLNHRPKSVVVSFRDYHGVMMSVSHFHVQHFKTEFWRACISGKLNFSMKVMRPLQLGKELAICLELSILQNNKL